MAMEKLKCDLCGGDLTMQAGGGEAVCAFCGMRYSAGRMREKVQEITGTVKIEGPVKTESADFEIRAGELVAYHGSETDVVIPEGVVILGDNAFPATGAVRSVVIPKSCREIRGTFNGCRYLEKVVIPEGVTTIGSGAFNGCISLKSVDIPNSVTAILDYAFCACTALAGIDIPNSVTVIGQGAFQNCTALAGIDIPNNVTVIDREAFRDCTALTGIDIPNSITVIGREAFRGCTALTGIDIPNSVTVIGREAFRGCTSLTSISIPDSVTEIGREAFSDCTALESAVISGNSLVLDGDKLGSWDMGYYYIGVFTGCSSLKDVVISGGVTAIGSYAFADCTALTNIHISNGLTTIGEAAFSGCASLTSISIPDSVTEIKGHSYTFYIFEGCTSLKSIKIPPHVKGFRFLQKELPALENVAYVPINDFETLKSLTDMSFERESDYSYRYCLDLDDLDKMSPWAQRTAARFWREDKRCQYCGGYICGLLDKRCGRCGRRKDY